jgi:hypothetical protein
VSLADALEGLLLDERRSQELAARGRRAVVERFTADRMAREFAEVCRMSASTTGGTAGTAGTARGE